jgi:anti-sigma factor RsiW
MRFWRRRRELVCREAIMIMSAYLDGELEDHDRVRLEEHLAECPHCSEYLVQLRVTIDALGRVDIEQLSDETVDGLVDLYRRWRAD